MTEMHWQYTAEINRQWKYWATWLPGVQLELGHTGRIKDLVFIPEGHLKDFGITFSTEEDPKPLDYEYATKGAYSFRAKAKGDAKMGSLQIADMGAVVEFTREQAIVFVAYGCRERRIVDLPRLEAAFKKSPKVPHRDRCHHSPHVGKGSHYSDLWIGWRPDRVAVGRACYAHRRPREYLGWPEYSKE